MKVRTGLDTCVITVHLGIDTRFLEKKVRTSKSSKFEIDIDSYYSFELNFDHFLSGVRLFVCKLFIFPTFEFIPYYDLRGGGGGRWDHNGGLLRSK